jgi:hypothetical protein
MRDCVLQIGAENKFGWEVKSLVLAGLLCLSDRIAVSAPQHNLMARCQ